MNGWRCGLDRVKGVDDGKRRKVERVPPGGRGDEKPGHVIPLRLSLSAQGDGKLVCDGTYPVRKTSTKS